MIELWYRVVRHWGKGIIIIYDRYFWDRYLALTGTKKVIGKVLFRYLFSKPGYIFYLYCDMSISLGRKTDILDIDTFKIMKETFDNEFLPDKKITKINTGLYNIQEVTDIIIEKVTDKLK